MDWIYSGSTYPPSSQSARMFFDKTGQSLEMKVVYKRGVHIIDADSKQILLFLNGTADNLVVKKMNIYNPRKTFLAFFFNHGGSGGGATANFYLAGISDGRYRAFVSTDSLRQIGWTGQLLSFNEKSREGLLISAQQQGVKQRNIQFEIEIDWEAETGLVKLIRRQPGDELANTSSYGARIRGDDVNLRAGPGEDEDVVATLPRYVVVDVFRNSKLSGFVKVRVRSSGQVGWVFSSFIGP